VELTSDSEDSTPSVEAIYEAAGFGATMAPGDRPALIVVDLTRGFTEPEFATGADLTDVVKQTAELVNIAHDRRLPVVYTVLQFSAAEISSLTWLRKATGLDVLLQGTDAVALDPRLPRRDTDLVVNKVGASAFFGTHLASMLTNRGVDTVVMCGATTSGCLRASVVDAIQSGFIPIVPRQCAGDRAAPPHEASLFDMQEKYADIVDVGVAANYLSTVPVASS
jgi:nicotinamidase-related amidase